ncbi:methyltransferase domain-containing protein [Algoriphagus sp. C2-6-M1]|uniref:methyltransferase domain-containing protein n=1 Tax=Algoriphagus persicinus TaxID=3108754 RepID=UPI002B3F95F9|nr:methyltransferase domain-containing protein [Algoriphagus sp. C2-6-M1]MEB2782427.1 methyltransferase domain-containing protein [Algoriphagus sp. C2-6-M1]
MIDFNPDQITFQNIDRFYIKSSILRYIKSKLKYFKGDFIDVGCGEKPYQDMIMQNSTIGSYVGVDLIGGTEYKLGVEPDFFWDGITFPFPDLSYDSALATEVLEHCPDPSITLLEIYRILKVDSPLLLTVPFIWPTHESPHDFYRYTPFGLRYLLAKAGFVDIEVISLGGWNASLAQVLTLWLKRSRIGKSKQKFLFYFLRPIIKYLIRKDRVLNYSSDQSLITSLGAIAWKK